MDFALPNGMDRVTRPNFFPCLDMRHDMDFVCILKACALIRDLAPGEKAYIVVNDGPMVMDLRRVYAECLFEFPDPAQELGTSVRHVVRVCKLLSAGETSTPAKEALMSTITVTCPHCGDTVTIPQHSDFAPQYHVCPACGRRFIAERRERGMVTMTEKAAPCMSNPECREVESSGSCEE